MEFLVYILIEFWMKKWIALYRNCDKLLHAWYGVFSQKNK